MSQPRQRYPACLSPRGPNMAQLSCRAPFTFYKLLSSHPVQHASNKATRDSRKRSCGSSLLQNQPLRCAMVYGRRRRTTSARSMPQHSFDSYSRGKENLLTMVFRSASSSKNTAGLLQTKSFRTSVRYVRSSGIPARTLAPGYSSSSSHLSNTTHPTTPFSRD